jgi:PAS domain S-box-containing protein
VRPYRTTDNRIDGAVLVLLDITDARRSVEQMSAARDYAEALVETIRVPLLVLDAQLRVRSASGSFLETFRVDREQTVGRSVFDLGNGQWDVPTLRAALRGVVERNGSFQELEIEHDFPVIGPRTFTLSARRLDWDDGKTRLALLTAQDITARRQADRELRASEEVRYRPLFETARDGIVLVDADTGKITNANPFFASFLHVRPEDVLGRALWELPAFRDTDVVRAAVRELQDRDFLRYDQVPLARADGRRLFAELSGSAYHVGGKRVIQCIVRDITDRTEFLEREQAARAQAESANRAKDEFLAVLSHELRTPLTAMLGWVRLVRSGRLGPEKTQQALEVIERNTRLQAQLIEDLLDVSRITTGKLHLEVLPVDLVAVIEAALDALRGSAEAKGVEIQTHMDTSLDLVPGDRYRLQQVVWNLVSNAVKFTPPGGRIDVRVERAEAAVRIVVSDTGRGIAADFLPHIFDRFRQAEAATTRTFGGLGLGLAIVRDLVELHGGTVRADSPGEGQGATFTVELPARPLADGAAGTGAERIQAGLPRSPFADTRTRLDGLRILLVEDDRDTREILVTTLGEYGATVDAVDSGAGALRRLAADRFDVLISDIALGKDSGLALLREVRALPAAQGGELPAVALTAFAGEREAEMAVSAGFQMHVPKPVEPADLVAVIATLTHRR